MIWQWFCTDWHWLFVLILIVVVCSGGTIIILDGDDLGL